MSAASVVRASAMVEGADERRLNSRALHRTKSVVHEARWLRARLPTMASDGLFEQLDAERRSGRFTTLRDWLAEHPPDPSRFTQTVAGVAVRTNDGDPFFVGVREFLDEFAFRPPELRSAAIDAEPAPTGERRFDAYLAALAEHLAVTEGLSVPRWTADPDRFLDRFWFVSTVEGFRALQIAESPPSFRRRGIFIAAGSLERV